MLRRGDTPSQSFPLHSLSYLHPPASISTSWPSQLHLPLPRRDKLSGLPTSLLQVGVRTALSSWGHSHSSQLSPLLPLGDDKITAHLICLASVCERTPACSAWADMPEFQGLCKCLWALISLFWGPVLQHRERDLVLLWWYSQDSGTSM